MSKNSSLVDTPRNTASDLDLRKTKCELFNKLVEPNQMIVAPPSKTSSDENINSTARGSNKMEVVASQGPTTSDQSDTMISDTEAFSDQELVMFTPTHNRWYTNEEIASILTSSRSHPEWLTNELKVRPSSGSCFLYNREKVRYRQDGYTWRKRRSGRTVREDHLRLKRQGIEFIYGNYVHSALLPSFHRRCYWLLESRENPNIILVHYLNQPPDDKSKMLLSFNPSLLEAETRRKWTNEEIIEEIGSVFGGISQIHHTLSINFPTTINTVNSGHGPTTEVHLNGDSFQTQQQQPDMDLTMVESNFVGQQNPPTNEKRDTKVGVKAQDIDQHQQRNGTGQQLAATIYTPDIGISHLKQPDCHQNQNNSNSLINDRLVQDNNVIAKNDDGCEMMIIINQDSNNASDFNQHSNTQKSNIDNHVYINNNASNNCARSSNSESSANNFDVQQQGHSDDAMTFDIVQESTNTAEVDSRVGQELSGYEGKSIDIGCADDDLRDHQVNNENNSKNFCDQTKSETGEPQMESGTCSPVTQIYNKIVDDIETYVLPLELNNFDPPNHLHHHHNHHQHHHSSFDVLQSMDTGELDHQQKDSYRVRQRHSSSVSASQFIADNDFGLDRIDGTRNDHDAASDMLLADFNLTRNDGVPNHHTTEMSPSVVDSISTVDDMREMLMMGISSTQDQTDDVQQSNHLLLGCDPSDPLDLFNLRPLHENKHHHHHLDVKSTTSETETLNRLSPTISMVPRCNSTDDAMQLSAQRLDQYQHHASSNYLRSKSDAQNEHLVNNFSQYNDHHHHNQNQDLIDNNARSATSTEPSNSTSCSASPSTSSLLNAATTSTGIGSCNQSARFGYLNERSTDGGSQSTGSAYNESLNNSSYMKLPLQQRQNSEQREPGNSVLSTLLPKALSLDGSDLSAHYYQNQHHRASPIVGAYNASKGHHQRTASQRHTSNNMYATNQMAHPSSHMLLVGPSNSHQHQSSRHHYYQRPSAPSISPSSGTYSMDSSGSGVVGKVMVTASQYRSVSVVATTMCHPQQQVQVSQQQQHSIVESVGSHARLLPILDYVPNWSPSSGGVKILIIGNWISLLVNGPNRKQSVTTANEGINGPFDSEQSHFSILFDDLNVPASLIQNNVLRCHSPQHKPGYIALKVLYKNLIVSEQVLFEIRAGECVESNSQITSVGQSAMSQKDSSSLTNFNQMKTCTN